MDSCGSYAFEKLKFNLLRKIFIHISVYFVESKKEGRIRYIAANQTYNQIFLLIFLPIHNTETSNKIN